MRERMKNERKMSATKDSSYNTNNVFNKFTLYHKRLESNLKGKAKIYINEEIPVLREKARSLGGYVIPFNMKQDIVNKILQNREYSENLKKITFKVGIFFIIIIIKDTKTPERYSIRP